MKKNIIISAMVFALAGATTSCSDFLDKEVDLTQQADNVFSDFDNTRGFLANIYTYLPDAFHGYTDGQYLNASKDAMTDNAVSYWDVHYYHQVHNDAFDATNHQFANYYYGLDTKGIRACNQFIKNARTDVIGNAAKSGDDNKLGDRWIAEARAIRALLTFDMACWFGPTPIFVNEDGSPYIMNTSDPMPARSSFNQVVDCANKVQEMFTCGVPVVKEFLVGLIVGLDLQNLHQLGEADVIGFFGLEPATVDATVLDEGGQATMCLYLREEMVHHAPG